MAYFDKVKWHCTDDNRLQCEPYSCGHVFNSDAKDTPPVEVITKHVMQASGHFLAILSNRISGECIKN